MATQEAGKMHADVVRSDGDGVCADDLDEISDRRLSVDLRRIAPAPDDDTPLGCALRRRLSAHESAAFTISTGLARRWTSFLP